MGCILNFLVLTQLILLPLSTSSQAISGHFSQLADQEIRLDGFNGLQTYTIASTRADQNGHFTLPYTMADVGMGYLMSADKKPYFVVLSGEEAELHGEAPSLPETVRIRRGAHNGQFARYATEHPRREQALSAWQYLARLYASDSLFAIHTDPASSILREIQRIHDEDKAFLASLDPKSYVRWYLPVRQLVSSASTIAQYRPEEIPAAIDAFRRLDYTDIRLYKSGLFKDALESQYWLLENCGKPLDSVYAEMRRSIEIQVSNLSSNERRLNEVTNYLFDLLERHSLFEASEYLALKVLNQSGCTIDSDLAKQLETYRAMKKGRTAPDITFDRQGLLAGATASAASLSLSEMKARYTLVVFGASWCPKCKEEVPAIAALYNAWKKQGVEVVFISLDDDKQAFLDFTSSLPFLSYCDLKKWKSPVAEKYYVFGTPTMYLLDAEREILLRPTSVKQVDAWVDWFLVQGHGKRE